MAVFKIHKTSNYTVVSTCHLREKEMSLKAKGLLTIMLSLPENWDYSVIGLAALSKDSKDAVITAISELESFGYLEVERKRNDRGQYESIYNVYEDPQRKIRIGSSESEKRAQYKIDIKDNNPSLFGDISPSKEYILSESIVDPRFDDFYERYDKKVQRAQALRMWKKLSQADIVAIMSKVDAYVKSTPDRQYRMNPATYINPSNRRWEDEIRLPDEKPADNHVWKC